MNVSTYEMSVEVKWENYMVTHKNRDLQKTVSAQISISPHFTCHPLGIKSIVLNQQFDKRVLAASNLLS